MKNVKTIFDLQNTNSSNSNNSSEVNNTTAQTVNESTSSNVNNNINTSVFDNSTGRTLNESTTSRIIEPTSNSNPTGGEIATQISDYFERYLNENRNFFEQEGSSSFIEDFPDFNRRDSIFDLVSRIADDVSNNRIQLSSDSGLTSAIEELAKRDERLIELYEKIINISNKPTPALEGEQNQNIIESANTEDSALNQNMIESANPAESTLSA